MTPEKLNTQPSNPSVNCQIIPEVSIPTFAINLQKEGSFISEGNDSKAYRVGPKVYKVYNFKDLSALELYRKITARAAALVEQQILATSTIETETETGPFRVQPVIVPIDDIQTTTEGYPVGISPYIKGPRLWDLLAWKSLEAADFGIEHPEECRMVEEFHRAIRAGEPYSYAYDTMTEYVFNFSQSLDDHLGKVGIELGFMNIKVGADVPNAQIRFTITDLCTHLYVLKLRNKRAK